MVFSKIIHLFVALIKYVVALIIKYIVTLIKYVVALIKYVARIIINCPYCQENAEREDVENPTPPFWHHTLLQRTLQTWFTTKLAVLPLGVLGIFLLYFDINIDPILRSERTYYMIGLAICSVQLYLYRLENVGMYFPAVGMVTIVVYLVITLEKILHNDNKIKSLLPSYSKLYNQIMWPSIYAALFIVVILPRIVQRNVFLIPLNSRLHTISLITAKLCLDWVFYKLAPMFIDTKDEIKQAIFVTITPLLPVIPIVICDRCTLIEISKITTRERGFVFVCLSRGIVIILCRIMQADFTSIWLFMGVSLFQGFLKVACKATEEFRGNVMTYFFRRSRNPRSPRFMADIEIQDILFEWITLILSQALVALSLTQTCGKSLWDVLNKSLVRIAIGLGIDFIFNCLSIFIQMRWCHVPLHTVWLNHWKYHMLVNVFALAIILIIYKPSLIAAYGIQGQFRKYGNYNCTSVFTQW